MATIKLTITGDARSGKSSLANYIGEVLAGLGIPTSISDQNYEGAEHVGSVTYGCGHGADIQKGMERAAREQLQRVYNHADSMCVAIDVDRSPQKKAIKRGARR